jgi:uncharacterized protein (DUF433 family)
MERNALRFGAETITRTTKASPRSKGKRKSRGKAVAALRSEFAVFADGLLRELAPEGLLASIHAERVIIAAWRLREAVEAEKTGILEGVFAESDDFFGRLAEELRAQTDRAERALNYTLALLRGGERGVWGSPARLDTTVRPVEDDAVSDQFPVFLEPVSEDGFDEASSPRPEDRLVFDHAVSETSPVVKGTWITVAQIVSLIVDGQTWADILRSHPELIEDDIRICLAYATEEESHGPCGANLS